jgi:amidase
MKRRDFLRAGALTGAATLLPDVSQGEGARKVADSFELEEKTIAELQGEMAAGNRTSESIVGLYLKRIEEIDRNGPALRSVIEVNPDCLAIAKLLDAERKAKGARGPLHGIPILIKDNIDTADRMMTTAGSLALDGSPALKDSFVAKRLRDAGAVILGKTNLSEWANFRSTRSTSGWSGRGGQTKNPYVLDRNPCGSSSGSGAAVAASLCAAAVGTETDGSVVCPSSANGIAGIKPTLGLISRAGIIPIAHSQDTAGPMARTLTDAVILLSALAGVDPRDAATAQSARHVVDYTRFLDRQGLRGKRIGVARDKFTGYNDATDRLFNKAVEIMKLRGAVIVDPANIPTAGKFDDTESDVLHYEFKADLNAYLKTRGSSVRVRSLREIIEFNEKNKDREMPWFGQEIMLESEKKGALTEKKYVDALAKNHRMSRTEGIDAVMDKHRLDALIAPTGGPAWPTDLINGDHFTGASSTPAAVAGYPNINVLMGYVAGLPVGLSIFGRAWSEPRLISIAYDFEQAAHFRRAPAFLPSLGS